MRLRRARAAALVGAVALLAPIPIAAVAGAQPGSSQWAGSAAADGVRVGVVVNEFLFVSNVVDAGGPVAQAAASSISGSRGLAAYPYPGEIVLTAHGQTSGAAPNYPLVAQSNNGGPAHSEVAQGPYDVTADSTDDSSAASAQLVPGGGGAAAASTRAQARVRHDPDSGTVTAAAESTVEGFSVAGVLSIGRVHSFARMASPGTAGKPASDTEFGDVRVGGQEVGVTDKGLVLAGTDVPLPPDSTANAALSAAGITVHYLAASHTASSVVAAGLSITATQDLPDVGETTVTYVLGQATATAQAAGASLGSSPPNLTGGIAPAPGSGSSAGTTAGGTAVSATAAGSPLAATPPTESIRAGAAPPAQQPVTAAPVATAPVAATTQGASAASLYVVVAGGAIVMAAAAQLFRVLAVRLAWK